MKKLLIIEDDQTFAAGLVRSLSRRGYVCMMAVSLDEARDVVKSSPPDHVLMDLNLGRDTTQNFVAELRLLCPKATLVMLTGFGSIPSAVQAIKDGAHAYLTKPVTPEAIDQALLESCAREATTPLWELENDHILQVLEQCGGNITQAARQLGLHRRTLQRRLKKT